MASSRKQRALIVYNRAGLGGQVIGGRRVRLELPVSDSDNLALVLLRHVFR